MTNKFIKLSIVITALTTSCTPASLGNSATDKILGDIENICLTSPTIEEANTYAVSKGAVKNGENAWWYKHMEDPTLSWHTLDLTDKGCKIRAEGWINEVKKPDNTSPLNLKKFKSKFSSYFNADYIKEKSVESTNARNAVDIYYVPKDDKTYGVKIE